MKIKTFSTSSPDNLNEVDDAVNEFIDGESERVVRITPIMTGASNGFTYAVMVVYNEP